eukprot:15217336-Heterocapsa_arctica.AAC.2
MGPAAGVRPVRPGGAAPPSFPPPCAPRGTGDMGPAAGVRPVRPGGAAPPSFPSPCAPRGTGDVLSFPTPGAPGGTGAGRLASMAAAAGPGEEPAGPPL